MDIAERITETLNFYADRGDDDGARAREIIEDLTDVVDKENLLESFFRHAEGLIGHADREGIDMGEHGEALTDLLMQWESD